MQSGSVEAELKPEGQRQESLANLVVKYALVTDTAAAANRGVASPIL